MVTYSLKNHEGSFSALAVSDDLGHSWPSLQLHCCSGLQRLPESLSDASPSFLHWVITVIQLSMWSQEEGEERSVPKCGGQMKTSRQKMGESLNTSSSSAQFCSQSPFVSRGNCLQDSPRRHDAQIVRKRAGGGTLRSPRALQEEKGDQPSVSLTTCLLRQQRGPLRPALSPPGAGGGLQAAWLW